MVFENNDLMHIDKILNTTKAKPKYGIYKMYSDFVRICKKKWEENKVWKEKENKYNTITFRPFTKTMKTKKLLMTSLIWVSTLWLMWCGQTPTQQPTETQPTTLLSSTSWTMCANAVKDYLDQADMKWQSGKQVKKWHNITVHYIGRLDDGTVFDTSVEEVAKACGKYMSGRNYDEGLSFAVGAGQMIAGFDKAVEGMNIGQTKTIHIEAKEAYGERSEKNIVKVPRDQIPDADKIEKGMKLASSYGQTFTVYAIDDKEITLDANHELAGKKLIFDITIKNIQE